MRITRYIVAVYSALREGGWMSAPDLAKAVGQPRQNLDSSIWKMIESGVVERNDAVRPIHYRLSPKRDAVLCERIEQSAELFRSEA